MEKVKSLTGAALLATFALCANAATYTMADVALHSTQSDCWMVLNSTKVYNVTSFLSQHPGGAAVMVKYCGKDGTAAFTSIGHSASAVSQEAAYYIGDLGTGTGAVGVSISPANANLTIGGTQQFTPKVTNSTEGVAWTVMPSTLGTISANGLFTAVGAGQGTVTATSVQDLTKSASATVTVNSSPPGPGAVTVSIHPSAVTLTTGKSRQFSASVSNSSQSVTWSVTGSIGTIDQNGLFTAALVPGTGTVVATSVGDPTKSSAAQVIINAVTCGRPPHHDDDSGDRGRKHDD